MEGTPCAFFCLDLASLATLCRSLTLIILRAWFFMDPILQQVKLSRNRFGSVPTR